MLRTVLLAVVACQCTEHALAVPFTFTRIADNSTIIPGGTGTFARFQAAPVIDGDAIAFLGYGDDGQHGIYLATPTGIEVLADTNAAGAFDRIFSGVSISGTNVAFAARDTPGNVGVFSVVDGSLSTVADLSSEVPSPIQPNTVATFNTLGVPSIDGDRVAFMGRILVQSTIFSNSRFLTDRIFEGGVTGGFVDVQAPAGLSGSTESGTSTSYDNGQLVYTATFNSIFDSYLWDGGAQPLNVRGVPVVGDGEVAFTTLGNNAIQIRDTQGDVTTLVTRATPIPGGVGNFTSFPHSQLSISEGNVAFFGSGNDGQRGLYTTLGGELDRVVAKGDILDGSVVSLVWVGNEAISGNALTFSVYFEDGSEAVYRAGAPNFWAMAEDGVFSDDTKWSDDVAPGSGETALFNQQGAYEITFNASVINQAAVVAGSAGPVDLTWNLAGQSYGMASLSIADSLHDASVKVTGVNAQLNVTGTATVGSEGSGVLEIVGGASADVGELRSGTSDSSHASVEVRGADTFLDVTTEVVLGSEGLGTGAEVSQGATVFVGGSTRLAETGTFGQVVVKGENSSWLAGGTTLSIAPQGEGLGLFAVKDKGFAKFATGELGSGFLNVQGTGSQMIFTETLNVGVQNQQTTVTVDTGGHLTAKALNIVGGAPNFPSEVTIDGDDSNLTVAATATVGSEGRGVLKILGGATVDLVHLRSGTSDSSHASVEVRGADTFLDVATEVVLGSDGLGTGAEVSQGATVFVGGSTRLAETGTFGQVVVKGENSSWLAGGTTLSIAPQGEGLGAFAVQDKGFAKFAAGELGLGFLNVQGIGSLMTFTETLNVGVNNQQTTVTVDTGGHLTAKALNIVGGAPNFPSEVTIDGDDSTLAVSGTATVGSEGRGVLNVLGGATVDVVHLRSGTSDSSYGRVEVRGADTFLDVTTEVVLGSDGLGTGAEVSQGATVLVGGNTRLAETGTFGQVVVKGENSGWLAGGTTLSIAPQGEGLGLFAVEDKGFAKFAGGELGSGFLNVQGIGSLMTFTETLNVGVNNQQTTVTVDTGGHLTAKALNIVGGAPNFPSEVTIDGPGSNLTVAAMASVGSKGIGVLNVLDGASVHVGQLRAGVLPGSRGDVLVSNATSLLKVTGDTVIGIGNAGYLRVTDGAKMTGSTATVNFAVFGTPGALVTGPGSRWDLTDTLTVGEGKPGHLQITDGGVVAAQSVIVGSDGLINGTGGTIEVGPGGVVLNGGVFAPGSSPGMMTVDGDYEQLPGGILEIEIGGLTSQSEYDLLVVTGDAAFGGTIRLKFIDGFSPHAGDEFDFLQVDGALTATGASYEIRNLEPGFEFDVTFDAGALTMTASTDGLFVPEPGTIAMLLSGLAGLLIYARSRR